ncbi:MAG: T9SS type A sorting domain-containing protein [Brumimicrobium sp.]|nr:T9SS type A sorting domain-containing protein [Brumimicrobium sp.]
MKKTLQFLGLSFLITGFTAFGQTTHNIDWSTQVGGSASITVNVGDQIIWTVTDNMTHDVISQDPNAPVGFGSGDLTNGQTYSFTFTSTAVFTYFCSYHPNTMVGTITVEDNSAGLAEQELAGVTFFPNPADNKVKFNSEKEINKLTVFNSLSQEVLSFDNEELNGVDYIDVSHLKSGTYFFKVLTDDKFGIYNMIIE